MCIAIYLLSYISYLFSTTLNTDEYTCQNGAELSDMMSGQFSGDIVSGVKIGSGRERHTQQIWSQIV